MADVRAEAPGKIILLGEHAVVHGQPAIAVPLSAVRAAVDIEAAPAGDGLTVRAPDLGAEVRLRADHDRETPADMPEGWVNALVYPVQLGLQALELAPPDLVLTVRSTIPIASGLGSGAAVAAALVRALGLAVGRPFALEALNALVFEVEKRHHGTPSGIDNTVIVYEQPVYFVRGQPPETFTIARAFRLLVGDTGQGSPTRIAVGDVRVLYEAEPERIGAVFARIGELVRAGRQAIETGAIEQLGPLMNENHALLRELTVSNAALDRLCAAALAAGAHGAKLSGGGRGGNMIALVDEHNAASVRQALEGAGAVRVIETVVGRW